MDKRLSWIFLSVSAAFFVFMVGLTGSRIESARRANLALAESRIDVLAAAAARGTGSFASPSFAREMRRAFDAETRLLVLAVHSPSDGVLYLATRNRGYLRAFAPQEGRAASGPAPDWTRAPAYQYSKGYEFIATRPVLRLGADQQPEQATVDGLFVIMGREDLYPILRDDLYLFLAFLLVCGVFILVVTGLQRDEETGLAGRVAAAPRPAAAEAGIAGSTGSSGQSGPRSFASPASGLVWAEHLQPRLAAELDRAASADQDIAFAWLRLDAAPADQDRPAVHAAVAAILRESFPSRDLIFETGRDSFAVVLPDTDIDQAVRSLDAVRTKAAGTQAAGRPWTLSVGATSRAGRLVEEKVMRAEARTALEKALREGGNRVVGFRADPSKFRQGLAS
jgi:GGDEF domain-containing protein